MSSPSSGLLAGVKGLCYGANNDGMSIDLLDRFQFPSVGQATSDFGDRFEVFTVTAVTSGGTIALPKTDIFNIFIRITADVADRIGVPAVGLDLVAVAVVQFRDLQLALRSLKGSSLSLFII